jgi:hypothetical protein
MNKKFFTLIFVLAVVVLVGISFHSSNSRKPVIIPAPAVTATKVAYTNSQYGFTFTLPSDWQGYSVLTETWTGYEVNCASENCPTETGPQIVIRNPQWTTEDRWQDIPIMIFTPSEWNAVLNENLGVSAAPIPPSELGRNDKYVFALPPRYNFAEAKGLEEVNTIIQGHPLKAL